MYDLPYHKEKNEQKIRDFISRYPFAFLSGCDAENKPVVTQLPVFIEEKRGKKILRGHIMKNTDHHRAFLKNQNVLAVFTGHHTYVSGTWYSNPHTPSTWNYMSVHAEGVIRFLDDNALKDVLRMTTIHFEDNNQNSETVFDNLPSEYTERLMKAIVAFEIEILKLDTVFKLSQDRDEESYKNIIKKLREKDESGKVIADEMEKRTAEVFPREKNPE
ncbi:MAG: FMN-binding negative transcriptional regulator [Bacteroidetes bacterium]|nr:FMN-binding negative transcriptional regulator [Bacteroidota bacterium]